MRVERERTPEPAARGFFAAEAALDHAAVEELERVAGPEPQRAFRMAERLGALAVPLERPGEDIVSIDARPVALRRAREVERLRQANRVVRLEQRDLEVRLDTVRIQETPDRVEQRVLALGGLLASGDLKQIAECDDELRQRDLGDGAPLERDRPRIAPLCRLDLRQRVEREDVSRERRERAQVLQACGIDAAARPVELAELNARPGQRLGLAGARIDGGPHRGESRARPAEQLA